MPRTMPVRISTEVFYRITPKKTSAGADMRLLVGNLRTTEYPHPALDTYLLRTDSERLDAGGGRPGIATSRVYCIGSPPVLRARHQERTLVVVGGQRRRSNCSRPRICRGCLLVL